MAQDRVEAVERALDILGCFNLESQELSLKQLAEKTGFYKSTILRLASSLERYGYLLRQSNGTYKLGAALIGLGEIARHSYDISSIVRPVLEELRDLYNESVAFYTRSGDMRTCLYRANAKRAIRHQLEEGKSLPLNKGAAGRILLAYADEPGAPYEQIRERGWYASFGERDPDVAAVGVPVFGGNGDIIAALCISGLISHFDENRQIELVEALKVRAADLSEQLGNNPSQ